MRWTLPVLLTLLGAANAAAVDLTGTWIGTIEKAERRPAEDVSFRIVQNGATLSGKAYNNNGPSAPLSGEVADGEVRFAVEAREQSGNQINIVVYEFSGRIDGDEIDMTRERASARDAVSGVDIPVRRPDDDEEEDRNRRFRVFRLERLF